MANSKKQAVGRTRRRPQSGGAEAACDEGRWHEGSPRRSASPPRRSRAQERRCEAGRSQGGGEEDGAQDARRSGRAREPQDVESSRRRGQARRDDAGRAAARRPRAQRGRPDPRREVPAARAAEAGLRGGALPVPRVLRPEPHPPAGARPRVDLRVLGRQAADARGSREAGGRARARALAPHAARRGPGERRIERHPAARGRALVVRADRLGAAHLPRRAGHHAAVRGIPPPGGEQHRRHAARRAFARARAPAHELSRRERARAGRGGGRRAARTASTASRASRGRPSLSTARLPRRPRGRGPSAGERATPSGPGARATPSSAR